MQKAIVWEVRIVDGTCGETHWKAYSRSTGGSRLRPYSRDPELGGHAPSTSPGTRRNSRTPENHKKQSSRRPITMAATTGAHTTWPLPTMPLTDLYEWCAVFLGRDGPVRWGRWGRVTVRSLVRAKSPPQQRAISNRLNRIAYGLLYCFHHAWPRGNCQLTVPGSELPEFQSYTVGGAAYRCLFAHIRIFSYHFKGGAMFSVSSETVRERWRADSGLRKSQKILRAKHVPRST